MTFNNNITLDTSSSRQGGGGSRGLAAGGLGGFGIIGAIIYFLVTGQIPDLGQANVAQENPSYQQSDLQQLCQTGEDANQYTECRLVAGANSLEEFWNSQLPKETGVAAVTPQLVLFTGSVSTACGTGSADMGPFYCSGDDSIYIDTSFFDQLEANYGAENAPLAQLYILAHEWGHHIQAQLGILQQMDHNDLGPSGDMVRSELQADCLAGAWVHHASNTIDPDTGVAFMKQPTSQEIQSALNAAAAVGDDRIYENAGMRVNPDNFSHGSAEKRHEWLAKGMNTGTLAQCDTWNIRQP